MQFGKGVLNHPMGISAGVTAVRQSLAAAMHGIPLERYSRNHVAFKKSWYISEIILHFKSLHVVPTFLRKNVWNVNNINTCVLFIHFIFLNINIYLSFFLYLHIFIKLLLYSFFGIFQGKAELSLHWKRHKAAASCHHAR